MIRLALKEGRKLGLEKVLDFGYRYKEREHHYEKG